MANAIYQVAKQFPKQKFAIIDSAPADAKGNTANLPNVANLFFKEQESGYLVGVIAGLMEKNKVGKATHNTIGTMGGISIPPVNRYIAGYVAGAQKVDPGIKILVGYSQSFTDQAKAKNIGLAQIGQGADILFQVAGASGLGYLAAAQEKAVYGIGADADQGYLGSHIITSALKRVDVAVRDTIHDAKTGRFKAGDHIFGLSNNGTGFAKPAAVVPQSIVSQADAYEKKIAGGQIVPPTTIPPHSS
jgi:basic membrane protein A